MDIKIGTPLIQALQQTTPRPTTIPPELYNFPPFLPKTIWTEIGNQIVTHEKLEKYSISGEKYITLRLDGHSFSNLTKKLKHEGIFQKGFSDEMANIMKTCCTDLMDFLSCKYGYTQSDEISVIIPPAGKKIQNNMEIQMPHMFNGRILKISTLAASRVTLKFNQLLSKLSDKWNDFIPTFDCRMAEYDTLEEAMSLFLWRSYDCGINGIADACYHKRGEIDGAKAVVKLGTDKKLEFLLNNNLLPLKDHQAYGSYYVRVKRIKKAFDNKNEEVTCLRSVVEQIGGNVLNLAVGGMLTPIDETL